MWNGKRVSVIFPTYNEKESIRQAIEDFFATGFVDEIVVVNNNAASGTKEEVARTRAKQVFEKKTGLWSCHPAWINGDGSIQRLSDCV
jgi:glycosyltransferase involved in cell wall biosynthesis